MNNASVSLGVEFRLEISAICHIDFVSRVDGGKDLPGHRAHCGRTPRRVPIPVRPWQSHWFLITTIAIITRIKEYLSEFS